MQIGTGTNPDGDMRLTVTYGPVQVSVLFSPDDEDLVMKYMREGFAEARKLREGNTNGEGRVYT